MNQAERDLIANLFSRIRGVEGAPRDPEAEAYISDQVARQPHAPYAMAQTVVVQDKALEAANARIEALERELSGYRGDAGRPDERSGASPWGPRAQDAMGRGGDDDYGRRDDGYSPPFGAPRSTPGARPSYGSEPSYGSQPGYGAPPSQQPPQPEASRGGGFLSGALQTAAGVAAGALLFQGVRSLFGGDEAQARDGGGAERLLGGDETAGRDEGAAQSASDAFQGWFGGSPADGDEPDRDDGDLLDPGGGEDRWI